jgi:hypothetical protein
MQKHPFILCLAVLSFAIFTGGCRMIADRQSTKTAVAAAEIAAAWTKTPAPKNTSTPTTTITTTPTAIMTLTLRPSATKHPTRTPVATIIPCMPGWERYEARTMDEVIAFHTKYGDLDEVDENEIHIEMSPVYQYPSRVLMTYGEEFREIGELRRMILTAQLAIFVPNFTEEQRNEMYQEEVLFLDGEKEYWIPVQSQLVQFIHNELSEGDSIVIYIIYLGATKEEGEVKLLFSVNAWQ